MYKILKNDGVFINIIKTEEGKDDLGIPVEPKNRHYQKYQAWLAEGNVAEIEDIITPAITE